MDSKEYSEQVRDLGDRFVNEYTRAWERYTQYLGDNLTTNRDSNDASRFAEFAQKEGPEFVGKLIQQSANYYLDMIKTGAEFNERLYKAAFDQGHRDDEHVSSDSDDETSTPSHQHACTELLFNDARSQRQSHAFIVSNKQAEKISVKFEISEFVSEDGATRKRIPVSFKPARFVLKPGEEKVVQSSLKATKTLPQGQRFQALARVAGFDDMVVRLVIPD